MNSSQKRVPFESIDESDLAEHLGRPFSGIAFDSFPNGKVRSEVSFIEGTQNGPAREWTDTGTLLLETWYDSGVQHGSSREWHPNGQLRRIATFDRGIQLEATSFDEQGNIVERTVIDPTSSEAALLETLRRRG